MTDRCIACAHVSHVDKCACGCSVVQVATSDEVRAADKFHAHIEEAIAYNLGLGYRGDLWAWIEPTEGTFKFHVARKPPVGDDGRFTYQVMKFDLSDEAKAQAMLSARKR